MGGYLTWCNVHTPRVINENRETGIRTNYMTANTQPYHMQSRHYKKAEIPIMTRPSVRQWTGPTYARMKKEESNLFGPSVYAL